MKVSTYPHQVEPIHQGGEARWARGGRRGKVPEALGGEEAEATSGQQEPAGPVLGPMEDDTAHDAEHRDEPMTAPATY